MELKPTNTENSKHKIKWGSYLQNVYDLAKKIKASDMEFDYIYGIPRGGNILSTILSHQLGIKYLYPNTKLISGWNILVVDDISDTGITLITECARLKDCFITVATLHKKPQTKFEPDFFIKEFPDDVWVEYPYEVKEI